MTPTDGRARVQEAVIEGWHPLTSANKSHDHWRKIQKAHHTDRDTAWATAKQAGWEFMPGRVRLTITLVYPRKYRIDADNLAARCKGLIDGLKFHCAGFYKVGRQRIARAEWAGYFEDDSTDYLELITRAEVQPGRKATLLTLESLEPLLAAGRSEAADSQSDGGMPPKENN